MSSSASRLAFEIVSSRMARQASSDKQPLTLEAEMHRSLTAWQVVIALFLHKSKSDWHLADAVAAFLWHLLSLGLHLVKAASASSLKIAF